MVDRMSVTSVSVLPAVSGRPFGKPEALLSSTRSTSPVAARGKPGVASVGAPMGASTFMAVMMSARPCLRPSTVAVGTASAV